MLFDLFQYGFMQRALISAIAIAVICSIVGLFLVLKRHSLFGDALAHVAFGGISLGLFTGIYPLCWELEDRVIHANISLYRSILGHM